MYVARLDRPWEDTPFLFQGFFVESAEQVEQLKHYCMHVYIDPLRKYDANWHERMTMRGMRNLRPAAGAASGKIEEWRTHAGEERYPIQCTLEDEAPAARQAHETAQEAMQEVVLALKRGDDFALSQVRTAVTGMVESVVRNPNALMWLTRMKDVDTYTYGHAVDVCAYLLAFGRHLGLPQPDLQVLGLGGLLLDIGKVTLPLPLLQKRGRLSEAEFETVRGHVAAGVAILKRTEGMPQRVLDIAEHHHERIDGSGYPHGLEGARLSLFARMAAIVDSFDAMSSARPYRSAVSPHEGLRMLYQWRDRLYHKGLVEQFIECLGIYPVGSLVELSTGEVAIVLTQNRFRQLKPRLVLVLDHDKNPYGTMDVLDLIDDPLDADGDPVEIARSLEPGMYGIEPRDYYL